MSAKAKKRKDILKIWLAVFFVIVVLLLIFQLLSLFLFRENPNVLKLDFNPNLEHRQLEDEGEIGKYEFEATVKQEDILALRGNKYNLLASKLTGSYYRIYFNDILIASVGDSSNQKSNIWNETQSFNLANQKLTEVNQIRLELFADYELGYLESPIVITDNQSSNLIMTYNNLTKDFIGFTIGLLIFTIILLFFIYNLSNDLGQEYLFYALAILCLLINIIDYLVIYYYPIPSLYFKKIVVSAMYLAVLFYSLAYYKEFNEKINLLLAIILLPLLLYANLFKTTLISFMGFINFMFVIYIMNIIGYFYTTIKNYSKNYKAKILLLTNLILISDSVFYLARLNQPLAINFFPMIFLALPISVILLVIYHYGELKFEIAKEKARADLMYQRSIVDTMTQVYNHQYVVDRVIKSEEEFVVLMIDIDDFKEVNDNYGHLVGDIVIIELANRLKDMLKNKALIGRYGGDEFVVVLFATKLKTGIKLAKKINDVINQPYQIDEAKTIDISISIGVYYSKAEEAGEVAINKADDALYKAKKNNSNQISIYN